MSKLPLISCIMPTRARRRFLAQARRLFEAQDYPNKELVTLEDGQECNWDVMAGTNYHHLGAGHHTIGYKRNIALWNIIARGDILCHWDDDDYYGPSRLSRQVQPLLDGHADVTALKMSLLLRTHDTTLWHCTDEVHKALFGFDVRCGTLMYRASYWHRGVRYADQSQGEDTAYLRDLLDAGARLTRLVDPSSYICLRHDRNITADIDGLGTPGWELVPLEHYIPAEDRAFYTALARECAHGRR